MLSKLSLKNFKLHASTTIEAAPVTVFIGPNNSGKSSLFQALITLRQAAARGVAHLCQPVQRQNTSETQPYLFPSEQLIDVGAFESLLHRGQTEIEIKLSGRVEPRKPLKYGGPVEITFEIGIRENVLAHHTGELSFHMPAIGSRGRLAWQWAKDLVPSGLASRLSIPVGPWNIYLGPLANFALLSAMGTDIPTNTSPVEIADRNELSEYLVGIPRQLLSSIHPIFPLRGVEESGYPLTDIPATNLERMTLADRTIGLLSILAYDPALQDKVSDWLDDLLQTRIRVKLLPHKRVTILCTPSHQKYSDTLFVNEGTGAGQLPFILVPIGLTPPGETILLSEPEAHLHPKAQSHLVSLLLKIAQRESRQFFIETHSEHILHSLLHAVATSNLKAEDLAIFYFENADGRADVRRLGLDSKGRVEGGLPGFFDHSLTELSEYIEALKKS